MCVYGAAYGELRPGQAGQRAPIDLPFASTSSSRVLLFLCSGRRCSVVYTTSGTSGIAQDLLWWRRVSNTQWRIRARG